MWFLALACLGVGVGHAGTYYGASNNGAWTHFTDNTGATPTTGDTNPARDGSGNLTFYALTSGGPGLSISGSSAGGFSTGSGNTTNTIASGGLTLSGGSEAFFQNEGTGTVTNTISGGMAFTDNSSAHFNNSSTGTTTNNINNGISLSGGQVDFYNSSTGSIENNITGGITLAGGAGGNFYNYGGGTATNTIDTINLNDGTLKVGGNGCTSTINTLNWAGGNVTLIYANGGFGSTHVTNLNVTGAVNLSLSEMASDGTENPFTLGGGPYTLFTFDTFTGDPSQITLVNTSALVEVTGAPGTNGITLNGSTATINLVPTASANNPADIETIQSPTDMPVTIVANEISKQFAPTPYQKAEAGARIQKALQQRKGGDSFENLLTALSEGGDANKFVKIAGDYRVFAAPYATYTRYNDATAGSSSKYYGMVMGLTYLVKSIDTNFFFTGVLGSSKTQKNRNVNSYITGKNTTLGISARKTFIKYLDVDSGLNLTAVRNDQWRQGNPTPNTSYIAKSKYNTYAVSWRNETGYIFKLPNKQSLKPNIGLQMNGLKQTAINERDAGVYAQSYKEKTGMNGELYGGLGYRKEWKNERFEGKLTGKYEIGRKSGNGRVKTTVYTASTPDGLSSSSNGPDLITHYLSVYGSLLDMKTNWKIVPGVSASFQKHQKSGTFVIKLERRF